MADTNLSAVLYSKMDIRMEEWPIPEPKEGEVQIAVHSTGICGSDVSYYTKGYIGDFVVKEPMVLGHESSGIVSKLGPGVTNLQVGDRVAMEPGIPCRRCEHCKGGRYNLCPDVIFYATPPVHGTLTRFTTLASDFCFKLPENVSMEEGAMLEPLSVAVYACTRAGVTIGKKVLVCGAGPIGLLVMMSAKAYGANEVAITDISQSRLDFAKKVGADHIILSDTKDAQEMARRATAALGGQPEISLDCSGAESAIQLAIYATKSGGVVCLVGLGPPTVNVPIVNAAVREVDIRGVFRYCNSYQNALDMIATGRINVQPLITHRVTLEQTLDAYKAAMEGNEIKIMIDCSRPVERA
ncbi:sorbitol dehydrogenase-like [Watersipora subatra]|uniref:sorbitol dehydrogenase-like n=1 Tax=Watersipora subatra TaxID=2589382 RepID=UPI00355AF4C3